MDSRFCGSCDADGRRVLGVLIGDGNLGATIDRRVCESRCLVTGDGLLPARDGTRRSGGETVAFLANLGAERLWRLDEKSAEDVLRPASLIAGEGVSESLSRRCVDVTDMALAPLPSSHGSFFPLPYGAAFFCVWFGATFMCAPDEELSEPATIAPVCCISVLPGVDSEWVRRVVFGAPMAVRGVSII